MHILLIDDNREILLGLTTLLKDHHFATHTASTLEEATRKIASQVYNLW